MFEVKHVRHTQTTSTEPIRETPVFAAVEPVPATAPVETGILAAFRKVNWKNVSDLVFVQTAVVLTGIAYVFLVPKFEETLNGLINPEAMQWPMRSICAVSHFLRDHPSVVALLALGFIYQLSWSFKQWKDGGSPEHHWIHRLNTHKHAEVIFNLVMVLPMTWFGIAVGSQTWAVWQLFEGLSGIR
jgi:hypothetical protein